MAGSAVSPVGVGASPILFKFLKPYYGFGSTYAGATLSPEGGAEDSFLTQITGMLGPNSRSPSIKRLGGNVPIDVAKDFLWTTTKTERSRADLPYVYMIEKLVDRSSRLQNLLYSTMSLLQTPLGDAAAVLLPVKAVQGAATAATTTAASQAIEAGAAAGGAGIASTASNLNTGRLGGLLNESYDDYLRAYSGLYSSEPTGFVYKMPFVRINGDISKTIGQSWTTEGASPLEGAGKSLESSGKLLKQLGKEGSGNFFGKVGQTIGLGSKAAGLASGALQYIAPAAYSEVAKRFEYGDKGSSFQIEFYLFNNDNWTDTVKNWYLVYGLQYQNLPNRLNRLILTPSVIYEVTVPGYFYSMYTYLSDIKVDNIGSSLLLDLPILQSNDEVNQDDVINLSNGSSASQGKSSKVNVIVPEIYRVSLTFQSLIPETQNLFYEANIQSRLNGPKPTIAGVINPETLSPLGNVA